MVRLDGFAASVSDDSSPVEERQQQQQQQQQQHRAIIDGPALAYHVYCSSHVAAVRHHPLMVVARGHEVIGDAAIAWLDELQRAGVSMCVHAPAM